MSSIRIAITLLITIFCIVSCTREEYTSGEAVFEGECVKCHMLNGKGGEKGPDLSPLYAKRVDAYVRTYIRDPRAIKPDSVMPPAEISDGELNLLIQYLKEKSSAHQDVNTP